MGDKDRGPFSMIPDAAHFRDDEDGPHYMTIPGKSKAWLYIDASKWEFKEPVIY